MVLPREILLALIFKVVVKAVWINVFVSVDQQDIWDRRLLDGFQYSHSFLRSKKSQIEHGSIGRIGLAAIYA